MANRLTGRDPAPNPNLMGWGNHRLSDAQNRMVERDMMEALPNACLPRDCKGASAMLPQIEKMIRSKFKFDEGFDLSVVERIVYRLSDSETLMVKQNMGNCVGDSHCCDLASRIAYEVLAQGDAEEPLGVGLLGIPFIPFSYGVGRWVGGMLGPGDGSYCGAQMEGTMKYGFLPCFTPGLDAYGGLPQSSSSVGRLFGKSKSEIEKWTKYAIQFDMAEAPVCRSADEAYDLIANKRIPLQICSGTMPTYWKFDDTLGIPLYRMGEPASHSTQIVGAFKIKGRMLFHWRNQWGLDAHKGAPEIGIVGGSGVLPAEELAKWLPRAECMGIGELKGLPSNPGA